MIKKTLFLLLLVTTISARANNENCHKVLKDGNKYSVEFNTGDLASKESMLEALLLISSERRLHLKFDTARDFPRYGFKKADFTLTYEEGVTTLNAVTKPTLNRNKRPTIIEEIDSIEGISVSCPLHKNPVPLPWGGIGN